MKLSGGNQTLRTSTLIRDRPDRGEEQDNLQGESDGSSSTLQQDSSLYDDEARKDFWSISDIFIYRHHVESRVKLYVSREKSFPIPLKYIDVTRPTNTSLDVMLEKIWTIIGTLMEIESVRCMDRSTRFIVLDEKPPDGYTLSWRRTDKKTNDLQTRHFEARDLG